MVDYSAYESITVDVREGVATIEFHRPEVYNALSTEVMLDLSRAFDELQLDRSVDAVVVTGEGEDAFSAGADIAQYAGPSEEHDPRQRDRQNLFYDIYRKPYDLHAPVIAKINGYCVGGGLILAMYCDLRIAVEGAKFGVPTANIGQIPTGGSTYRAVELVGEAKAKELVFTAGMVDAAEAHRIGLVNRVVPRERLDAAVDDVIGAIQDTGRLAVKNSKRAINESVGSPDLETARAVEEEIWWEQFATGERERLVDEFNEG
ncbi:enoyl-CoA hydratase/isomerase family protein [Halomarina pelagica]|uniref:enoyl-CoA hydratase/isomerase family protein n=1 Tax=Halomarina pelagica TaxID=2961599 RepID=UPI0020C51CAA|nr:enoyl-CoA hydratase/isomerase family protein [Halomarina sp. BND7]